MRIGVSALGVHHRGSGVDRYVFNVLKYMIDGDHQYVIFGDEDALPHYLKVSRNVSIITVNRRWRTGVGRVLWHLSLMLFAAWRHRIDVFWIPNNRLILWKNVRVVMTIHDLAEFSVSGKYDAARMFYRRKLMRVALGRVDRVITDSLHSKKDLLRIMHLASQKVAAIPLGAEPFPAAGVADDEVLARYGIDRPYILYVGRLEHPGKNIPATMDAVAAVRRQTGMPLQLVVIGADSWRADAIRKHATEAGYCFVKFLGFVPDAEVGAFYRQARALALLSLYEGFGLPAVEAMRAGTPVVASNRSSLPEVVGSAGILVDPTSPPQVIDALLRITTDDSLYSRLALLGPKRASLFNWKETANQTLREITESGHEYAPRHSS